MGEPEDIRGRDLGKSSHLHTDGWERGRIFEPHRSSDGTQGWQREPSYSTKLPAGSGLAALRAGMDDAAHAAAAEFEKQSEEQIVQQPAQQAIEKENAEPMWNVGEWLRSLNYEEAVRELLEKAAKDAGMSPP